VKAILTELAQEGIEHVRRLRAVFIEAGKVIVEACPVQRLK
jgi:hypothetical protein